MKCPNCNEMVSEWDDEGDTGYRCNNCGCIVENNVLIRDCEHYCLRMEETDHEIDWIDDKVILMVQDICEHCNKPIGEKYERIYKYVL